MTTSPTRLAALAIVTTLFGLLPMTSADDPLVLRDDFEDTFKLDWTIIRPVPDHYNLAESPGELVLTTHYGSIHGATSPGDFAKNLMLINRPIDADTDFVATLAVNEFQAKTYYHQVALLVYQGDDDYLKWSMERSWQADGVDNLVLVGEAAGQPNHYFPTAKTVDGPFWLRLKRTGDKYTALYSNDGEDFEEIGTETWTPSNTDTPVKAGFLAKNGGNPNADDIDVYIESYELKLTTQ